METLQRTANRGSISTGYDIDNSLKFEADNAERMQRTSAAIGTPTSTQKATISAWVKRTELQSSGNSIVWIGNAGAVSTILGFNNDRLDANTDITGGFNLKSTPVFRDTSAWYHIVWAFDTTQATAANRVKLYVNGVQIEDFDTETYPNQNNAIGLYEINMSHYIGWSDAQSQSGYYSEFYLIDGQQLAPTDFGEFDDDSGIWKPKAYTGTFGNEGYYIDFEDSANLGDDVSGNGNDFTLNNIAAADQATDTPTNNFATFNVLQNNAGDFVFTEGATTFNLTTADVFRTNLASIAVTNGKWYAEFSGAFSNNSFCGVGVMDQVNSLETNHLGAQANTTAQGMGYYSDNGDFYRNAGSGAWGDSYTTDDIIGVALDYRSDGTAHMYVAKNGTWQNSSDPATDTNPLSLNFGSAFAAGTFLAIGASIYSNDGAVTCNFGGYTTDVIASAASDANGYGTFEYAPPTGYYALCTKNLAEFG
jgi:hypothetical protein